MEMKNIHTNNEDGMNESSCCTPFVSAPSSPGRTGALFFSAPASPMHFLLSSHNSLLTTSPQPPCAPAAGNEFDFDANSFPMSSADELFFNGQIRPMKQNIDDVQEEVSDDHLRGRSELRNRSLRRVRSEEQFQLVNDNDNDNDNDKFSGQKKSSDEVDEGRPWLLRNSKRWVSLFLYRSKSEGRNSGRHKYFWSSFSPVMLKGKKTDNTSTNNNKKQQQDVVKEETTKNAKNTSRKSNESSSNSQRLGLSAHYKANRAQSEEMRKKTYLPYRQGIFGCIGLNPTPGPPASFNAFAARAFNSVSS